MALDLFDSRVLVAGASGGTLQAHKSVTRVQVIAFSGKGSGYV
jgi:hypothetical protein